MGLADGGAFHVHRTLLCKQSRGYLLHRVGEVKKSTWESFVSLFGGRLLPYLLGDRTRGTMHIAPCTLHSIAGFIECVQV